MSEEANQAPVQQPEDDAPEYTNQRVNWINPLQAVDEMGRQANNLGQRVSTQFRKDWGITQFNNLTEEMKKSPYLPEDLTAKGRKGIYRAIKLDQKGGFLTQLVGEDLTTSNAMDEAILKSAELGYRLANGDISAEAAKREQEDIAQSLRPEDIAGTRVDIIGHEVGRRAKFAGVGMAAGGAGAAIATWRALSPKPDAGGLAKLTNALFIQAPAALVAGAVGALAGGALTGTIGAKAMDMFGKGSYWALKQMGYDSVGAAANDFVGGKKDYNHEIKTVLQNAMELGAERARTDDPRLQAEAEMQRQRAQQIEAQKNAVEAERANVKANKKRLQDEQAAKQNTPNPRTPTPAPTTSVDSQTMRDPDKTPTTPGFTIEELQAGSLFKGKSEPEQAVVKAQAMEFLLDNYHLDAQHEQALKQELAALRDTYKLSDNLPKMEKDQFLKMPVSDICDYLGANNSAVSAAFEGNMSAGGKRKMEMYKLLQENNFKAPNKGQVQSESVMHTAPAMAKVEATPEEIQKFAEVYANLRVAKELKKGVSDPEEKAQQVITLCEQKLEKMEAYQEFKDSYNAGNKAPCNNPFLKAVQGVINKRIDQFDASELKADTTTRTACVMVSKGLAERDVAAAAQGVEKVVTLNTDLGTKQYVGRTQENIQTKLAAQQAASIQS